MDRIDKILENQTYKKYMKRTIELEVDRIFCGHDLEHALDVARIAYIMCLELDIKIDKEIIYAMALLHDIGRFAQYELKVSHHEKGAELAEEILDECGFDSVEKEMIVKAIKAHHYVEDGTKDLTYILYKADKLSRNCFDCNAKDECYWGDDIRNHTVTV